MQAECDAVPATPYLGRIQKVVERMPIKALGNRPLGSVNLSNVTNPSSNISGIPPSSGDAEAGANITEPSNDDSLFPGALSLNFKIRVCF
jgi:hypothetical protein